jgi:hypothetical protein
VVGHDGQVTALGKRGVLWEKETVVRETRGERLGETRPGWDVERVVVVSEQLLRTKRIQMRCFDLDQRIESVQFKTWQVLKEGTWKLRHGGL